MAMPDAHSTSHTYRKRAIRLQKNLQLSREPFGAAREPSALQPRLIRQLLARAKNIDSISAPEPTVAHTPSISTVFACSIASWRS